METHENMAPKKKLTTALTAALKLAPGLKYPISPQNSPQELRTIQ